MSSFDADEIIDPTDVEFFKFSGLVPDAKVSIQQEPFDTANYPATVSLLACSNKFGQFVTATKQGFVFGLTKTLRTTFYSANKGEIKQLGDNDKVSVPLTIAVRQIRFSADEKQILIAFDGGSLSVYNTDDIQSQRENVQPVNTFQLGTDIADLRPNPEAYGNIAAVLYTNQQCVLIDFSTGNTECTFPLDNVTAICWSFKGKQIVCGKSDGGLQHFDIKGAVKDSLSIPEAMRAGHGDEVENRYVCDVLWIENHIFLAMYARKRNSQEDDYINDGYIINRKPATGTDPVYTRLAEITPIFTTDGRGNHFYMETIRGLGSEIKHLIIIANAATSEISVVGHDEHDEWTTWQLPENGLANLPLSPTTSMDTFPVGLALDFTADEKLPAFDPSEKDVGVEPMPVFYYLNDEGEIGSFHCYNSELARRGESYKNESSTAPAAATTAAAAAPATTVPAAAAPSAAPSGFSAFGSASNSDNGSSFADLLSGKTSVPAATSSTTGAGFAGFGSFGAAAAGGSIPSFSNLGSAPKISSLSFGSSTASSTATPTFGSSSGFGSATAATMNKDTSKPLFGSTTSFGVANKNATPAFGSTSSFGVSANKSTTSSFGSTSSLGAAGNPPATSLFGSSSTFGSAKSTTSPFLSSSTTGAFGAPAQTPTSAASATSKDAGASSKTEPDVSSLSFGSLSTNDEKKSEAPKLDNTTTAAPASAFGSTSTLGSGGFGSLAKNTVPGAKSPSTTIPSSLFSKSTTPGATAPSANAATTTKTAPPSLFGSTSTMKAPATNAFRSTSTLGSGGFGSLAKNTVPGAKSPAATPGFGSPTSFGAAASDKTTTTTAAPATITPSTPAPAPAPITATPATTTPKPTVITPAVSSKPTIASAPATTIAAQPKEPAKTTTAESPAAKLKPTAEEGMAKEYEELYIKVTEEIEKLKDYHNKLTLAVKANTMSLETKSVSNLNIDEVSWNLNDAKELESIADALIADIKSKEASLQQTKQQVNALVENCKKSMDKKEDIKYLLGKDFDPKVVDILDSRELDVETKKTFIELQSKSKASGNVLDDLEFKVQENKKRNKIRNAHNAGSLSMYTLHRAIRDIEREIVHKEDTLTELGDQIAAIKLTDSRIKARRGAAGISCDDLSDSEQEDNDGRNSRITPAVIEHTTRYLRRYQFLDTVSDELSKSGPVYTCIE